MTQHNMKISLVTDEISADPETAIELGVEWGVHNFELRGYGTDRVPLLSDYQKQRLKDILLYYNAQIIAISPGLFKIPFYPERDNSFQRTDSFPLDTIESDLYQGWRNTRDAVKYHLNELLPLSIEYAKEIGASIIVVFSFIKGINPADQAPDGVFDTLMKAADQVQSSGLKLAVEVEPGYWADTGIAAARILKAIDHPALGVNWDPGNSITAGERPFPEGYDAVGEFVRHVHFKDVEFLPNGGHKYVIEGEIDWAGQIQALKSDGFTGYISVEPHMRPKVKSTMAMVERLKGLLPDTVS